MKIELVEEKYGTWLTFKPESVSDVAQLLRISKSSKKQKPEIYFSFNNEPYLQITMRKISPEKQNNSIVL